MSDATQTARERILALDAPRTDVVDMPEWGMKVCVATLSLLDSSLASALEAQAMGPADAPRYPAEKRGAIGVAAHICVAARDPDTGARIFEDGDVDAIAKLDSEVVSRLYLRSRRLSAAGPAGIEGEKKG